MRRRFGLDIPAAIEDACDPAAMAVIVYDMQAGVLGQLPDGAETVDLGLIPVVVTDACGGRDRPAMQRVLDSTRFSGDALLTDIATITPLLASASPR